MVPKVIRGAIAPGIASYAIVYSHQLIQTVHT
jgi:hypothetical protein